MTFTSDPRDEITKQPIEPHTPISEYRFDIDGLRGISIAAVVLFHAHAPDFAGENIGVDVFFVISGFLITSILQRRNEREPEITIIYGRRIRRLFFALFVVLLFRVAISFFLLLPTELDRLGQSLVATAQFVPDIFF